MMRSLYSGVSGLRNHQTRMDVIANNISNVNTSGYKTSRVVFQDIFSQTSRSASASTDNSGGTNPMQIGLGISLATIDVIHTASAFGRTDRPLDLAINGEGFFVVETSDGAMRYTRAGNFYLDNDNYLVDGNGNFVQGFEFTPGDPTAVPPEPDDVDTTTLTRLQLSYTNTLGDEKRYDNISIDDKGYVRGEGEGGVETIIGYLAMATFNNTSGLEKVGGNMYRETANSGAALYSQPQTEGAGEVMAGGLEMSNVDLSSEFTDMIVTQRGFQANSRIITVSDTMLEELINLKR